MRLDSLRWLVAAGALAGLGGCGPDDNVPAVPDAMECTDRCSSVGAKQCITGGYQECGNFDQDSCLEWGPTVACGGGQRCVSGECQSSCTDECTDGSRQCEDDGTGYEACVADPVTGCMVWSDPVKCDAGQSCSEGRCSGSCTDECADGSRQCAGAGYQVCSQHDGDTCLDWGPVTACTGTETCSEGYCGTSCTNECTTDARECAGTTGYHVCGQYDADSCLEWGAPVTCPDTQTCSNGTCSGAASCTDECTASTKQCNASGNGYQACGNTDADSCLEWGAVVTCSPGQTCSNGECVAVCTCDFFPDVCEPNAPGTTTECACDPDCAAGSPCVADAHCDSWCPVGVDPDCSCACDYNEYCEADAPGSYALCDCDPSCEPHEYACSDDGHCDTFCPTSGVGDDPDCGVDACRARWMDVGWRWASEAYLDGAYEAPDPDEGGDWVLLSPGLSGGGAEIFVEMAAEHAGCVDQISVEAYGYDDSVFGDGAEMYLYNWDTGEFDLLADSTVGFAEDWYQNITLDPTPYLLCESGDGAICYIDAKVGASGWDNTHVEMIWVMVHMAP